MNNVCINKIYLSPKSSQHAHCNGKVKETTKHFGFSTIFFLPCFPIIPRINREYQVLQGTTPSMEKHPSRVPMWKGVKVAAMCLFSLMIGGY
jgi:hypothetical protein